MNDGSTYRDFVDNHPYSAGHRLARVLARFTSQMEVYGKEHLPKGGALLMCNHASYLDPLYIGGALDRELWYMARSTLFVKGQIDRILQSVNAFPVQRGRPDRGALKRALRLAQDGKLVVIFPEGTRSRDGTLSEAAAGAAFLAYQSRSPVVPVYLSGMYRVLPRGRILPRFAKVRVYIGLPLDLEPLRKQRGREAYKQVGRLIMAEIAKLQEGSLKSRYNVPSHQLTSRSRLGCPIERRS